jgi:hypothetical protein
MNSSERTEHLRNYIIGCLKAGILSVDDLKSGKFLDKLLKVMSQDMKFVLRDLMKVGVGNLAQLGIMKLMQVAQGMKK